MGSPLEPAMANLFMVYNEQRWLESDYGRLNFTIGIWMILFVVLKTLLSFDFLNIKNRNLNVIIEKKHMVQLPFLLVLNTRSDTLISLYEKCIHRSFKKLQ